ncbi:hypothetical protein [Methylobacterium sp. CM6247]
MAKPFKRTPLAGGDVFGKKPATAPIESGPATTQPRKPATAQTREPAKRVVADDEIPEGADDKAGLKMRVRYEKPHVSLYASPETFKAIKRLALDEGTTAQALYRKGLLLMMREYGIDRGMTEDEI